MTIYNNIAKALYVSGMLPLDAKTYFSTLLQLGDLGPGNSQAFVYYEYMLVLCAENGQRYVWKEVDPAYTGGVITENYQYPADVQVNNIDYSQRYFNFVPESAQTFTAVSGLLIFKSPTNDIENQFLEPNDVGMGFFAADKFFTAVYIGGPVIDSSSWEPVTSFNPIALIP